MKHMRQKHTSVWSPAAWRRWDLARMCCTNFEVGSTVQSGLPMASAAVAFYRHAARLRSRQRLRGAFSVARNGVRGRHVR